MNINKKDLEKIIRETIESTMQEIDKHNYDLQRTVMDKRAKMEKDKLLFQLDDKLTSLRELGKMLRNKEDPQSMELLKAMNASLEGFVSKVMKVTTNK